MINENLFYQHIPSDVKGLFSRCQVAVIQRAEALFKLPFDGGMPPVKLHGGETHHAFL